MSKRILPVVLVLCIIMAMAPAAFATGEVEPAWDGVTREDIPFVNGRYEISTGAQLARLSDNVNSGTSYNGQTIVISFFKE